MARDINKDLTNLLKDCYVWNMAVKDNDRERLDVIQHLALLAGDLASGYNADEKNKNKKTADVMCDYASKLADTAKNLWLEETSKEMREDERLAELLDETV